MHKKVPLKSSLHNSEYYMSTKKIAGDKITTDLVMMRLYIADGAPNSAQAIVNLEAICKEYPSENFQLDIIDVIKFPLRAMADGILVTPSLNKISPAPAMKIVGNLKDKNSVRLALGINKQINCVIPPTPPSNNTVRELN